MSRSLQALHTAGISPESILSFSLAEPESLPVTLPPETTALILTSRLGVPSNAPFRHLPTYCVGGCTAKAAKTKGFNVVYTGVNNGHTMAHDILQQETLLHTFAHLHGDHAGMDWHPLLTAAGHTVTPILAYRTNHITTLPESIREALLIPRTSYLVPLFSSGSARHLANLLKQANIPVSGTALCLTKAVATEAIHHWPHVHMAPQPTLEGIITLLTQAHQEQNNL
jgi:uroporphyrinogen-III synthase